MKNSIFLFFIIFSFSFYSCSSNKLIQLSKKADCSTTIEGRFLSNSIYKYRSPAVLYPRESKIWIRYGKVIKEEKNGILFEETNSGLFTKPDTLFINYDEIRAIVDSNKYCVWGKLKEKEEVGLHFTFLLKHLKDPQYEPIYLSLFPNKNFAYCAKPGKYEITSVTMIYPDESDEYYYTSVYERVAQFEVEEGKANYLGDIKLLYNQDIDSVSLLVPYKEQTTGASAGSVGGFLGGAIGGAISGAVVAVINASADSSGVFAFRITHDIAYTSESDSRVKACKIIPLK